MRYDDKRVSTARWQLTQLNNAVGAIAGVLLRTFACSFCHQLAC